MDWVHDVVGFALKGLVVFGVVAASAAVIAVLARRRRRALWGQLEVKPLNRRYRALGEALRHTVLGEKAFKAWRKGQPKDDEARAQAQGRVYVLDFEGDLLASATANLREEVSAIVSAAAPGDEVVVRLESGGGAVAHYGLAASQLARLKDAQLKVTVCVDRVAASGGYLMACVADRVVAAPFAVVGSIGVVAQVPNVNRLLKRLDVDYEEVTAGEFKRTVSLFGEITPKGRQKLTEQLEETHGLFKDFVKQHRPALDLAQVATGEYWLGTRAKALGLVDQLATSDEYLLGRLKDARLYSVRFQPAEGWRSYLALATGQALEHGVLRLLRRLQALALR